MKKIIIPLLLILSFNIFASESECSNPPTPAINEYPGCHAIYVGVIASFMIDPIGALFKLKKISRADDLIIQAHAGYGCELSKFQNDLKRKHHINLESLSQIIVEMDENRDFCFYKKDESGNIRIDADSLKTVEKKIVNKIIEDER